MSSEGNRKSEKIVEDIFGVLVPGNETNIDCYTQYAKDYDEGLNGINYENPKRFATMAMKNLKTDSSEMQALDICAGTGLMGEQLRKNGFKGPIDAIDGNETMMEEAKKKNIFRNFVKMIIVPGARLPYPDNTYDIALCGGAFSAGHLRPECIPEFIRVLKPGGTLTFNTTNFNEYDEKVSEDDLNKANVVLDKLQKQGVCELAESMTSVCFTQITGGFKYKNGNIDLIRCYVKL